MIYDYIGTAKIKKVTRMGKTKNKRPVLPEFDLSGFRPKSDNCAVFSFSSSHRSRSARNKLNGVPGRTQKRDNRC